MLWPAQLARVRGWGPGTPGCAEAAPELRAAESLGNCQERRKGRQARQGRGHPRMFSFASLLSCTTYWPCMTDGAPEAHHPRSQLLGSVTAVASEGYGSGLFAGLDP